MDPAHLQGHGQQKVRPAAAPPRHYDGENGNPLYDPAHNGGHYGELPSELKQRREHG